MAKDGKKALGVGAIIAAILALLYFWEKTAPPDIVREDNKYYCPYQGEELRVYAGGWGPVPKYRVLPCPLGHGPIRVPGAILVLDVAETPVEY